MSQKPTATDTEAGCVVGLFCCEAGNRILGQFEVAQTGSLPRCRLGPVDDNPTFEELADLARLAGLRLVYVRDILRCREGTQGPARGLYRV